MNSIIEARELTLKYLEPIVKKHGFNVKLSSTKQARIERKRDSGTDVLAFDMLTYTPAFRIRYAFNKINVQINNILLRLQERIALSAKEDKKSWFIFFSYNTLHDPTETTYLPFMETEEDVQKCVASIESFMVEAALPLLIRFEDLGEVDKIINGERPWETDWHKPYVFGGNFHLKRLIISKLAGLDSYDRIFGFVRDFYASHFNGEYGSNYKARMAEVEELDKVLKNETLFIKA
jgi:hypothetical protein